MKENLELALTGKLFDSHILFKKLRYFRFTANDRGSAAEILIFLYYYYLLFQN